VERTKLSLRRSDAVARAAFPFPFQLAAAAVLEFPFPSFLRRTAEEIRQPLHAWIFGRSIADDCLPALVNISKFIRHNCELTVTEKDHGPWVAANDIVDSPDEGRRVFEDRGLQLSLRCGSSCQEDTATLTRPTSTAGNPTTVGKRPHDYSKAANSPALTEGQPFSAALRNTPTTTISKIRNVKIKFLTKEDDTSI
jgi:hypothetical protein